LSGFSEGLDDSSTDLFIGEIGHWQVAIHFADHALCVLKKGEILAELAKLDFFFTAGVVLASRKPWILSETKMMLAVIRLSGVGMGGQGPPVGHLVCRPGILVQGSGRRPHLQIYLA
jgi:hypothetical protein